MSPAKTKPTPAKEAATKLERELENLLLIKFRGFTPDEQAQATRYSAQQIHNYLIAAGFKWENGTLAHDTDGIVDGLRNLPSNADYKPVFTLISSFLNPEHGSDMQGLYLDSFSFRSYLQNIAAVLDAPEKKQQLARMAGLKAEIIEAAAVNLAVLLNDKMHDAGKFTVEYDTADGPSKFYVSPENYPEFWITLSLENAKDFPKILNKFADAVPEYVRSMKHLAANGVIKSFQPKERVRNSVLITEEKHKKKSGNYKIDYTQNANQVLNQIDVIERAITPKVPKPKLEKPANTDPVIIALDANMLVNLAASQEDNGKTFLELLEQLTSLPNVTVVVPSFVANLETRGISETWQHNGSSGATIVPELRNLLFSPEKSDKPEVAKLMAARASKITSFFDKAYRIKLYGNGSAPEVFAPKNANPRLIICETDECRTIDQAFNRIKQDSAKIPSGIISRLLGQDKGEHAIDHLLKIMPINAPAIVLCDENEYDKKGVKKTGRGRPVHHAGIADLVTALYPDTKMADDMQQKIASAVKQQDRAIQQAEGINDSDSIDHSRFRVREAKLIAPGAESLADVIARGRKLQQQERILESPFKAIIDKASEEKKPVKTKSKPNFLGLRILSAMHDHGITEEQMAEEVNKLNKVYTPPETPAMTVQDLRGILKGRECPDQDTLYALLDVLVWQNDKLDVAGKKAQTKIIMDAWNDRQELDASEGRNNGQKKNLDEYTALVPMLPPADDHARYGFSERLDDIRSSKMSEDTLLASLNRRPSLKPFNSADRKFTNIVQSERSNNKIFVVRCVEAIEKLSKAEGGLSYEEKLSLFNEMLDANGRNGHSSQNAI